MYDICHPSYYYISRLGCNDPLKISTAFNVYLELCEARRYWEVNYNYNDSLDLLYLKVKRNKNSESEFYVPWPASTNISLDKIRKIQQGLNAEWVTLVFKSDDTTSIMYKVSKGLVKPMAPEVTKLIKEKEEKKSELEREIRRNTSHLYELAKTLSTNNTDKNTSPSVADCKNKSNE